MSITVLLKIGSIHTLLIDSTRAKPDGFGQHVSSEKISKIT